MSDRIETKVIVNVPAKTIFLYGTIFAITGFFKLYETQK
jgi:hypothetical protein